MEIFRHKITFSHHLLRQCKHGPKVQQQLGHVTRAGSSHTYTRAIDKIRVCPWFPYISVISAQCCCAPYEQYEQTWQQARLIIKTIYFGPLIRFLLRDRGQYRTGVRWGQSQTCKQCLTMLRMEITILDRGTIQHSTEPRVRWGQLKMQCLWQ